MMTYPKISLCGFIFCSVAIFSCGPAEKPVLAAHAVNNPIPIAPKNSFDSFIAGSLYLSFTDDEDHKMSRFKGGEKALRRFIQANHKPVFHTKKDTVGVKFTVDTTGHLCNFRVFNQIDDCLPCNEEALRIAKSMPDWEPGYMRNGDGFRKISTGESIWVPFDK
eukprot:gene523-730_t